MFTLLIQKLFIQKALGLRFGVFGIPFGFFGEGSPNEATWAEYLEFQDMYFSGASPSKSGISRRKVGHVNLIGHGSIKI